MIDPARNGSGQTVADLGEIGHHESFDYPVCLVGNLDGEELPYPGAVEASSHFRAVLWCEELV